MLIFCYCFGVIFGNICIWGLAPQELKYSTNKKKIINHNFQISYSFVNKYDLAREKSSTFLEQHPVVKTHEYDQHFKNNTVVNTFKMVSICHRLLGAYLSATPMMLDVVYCLNSTSQDSRKSSNSFIMLLTLLEFTSAKLNSTARLQRKRAEINLTLNHKNYFLWQVNVKQKSQNFERIKANFLQFSKLKLFKN